MAGKYTHTAAMLNTCLPHQTVHLAPPPVAKFALPLLVYCHQFHVSVIAATMQSRTQAALSCNMQLHVQLQHLQVLPCNSTCLLHYSLQTEHHTAMQAGHSPCKLHHARNPGKSGDDTRICILEHTP